MMDDTKLFQEECKLEIEQMGNDTFAKASAMEFINKTAKHKYSYHFEWMGMPIIQYPQDIVAIQELVWNIKPDLIIETGVARGGSLVFYASMIELLKNNGQVVGIDIDIRNHNRKRIEAHPMFSHIKMIEGSSIDQSVINQVYQIAENKDRVLLILDSMHTHDHVLAELRAYSALIKKDSYIVVCDTIIEDYEKGYFYNRPWDKGDNPKTAVWEFLKENDRFKIDDSIENKLMITVCPDGYLKCVRDL